MAKNVWFLCFVLLVGCTKKNTLKTASPLSTIPSAELRALLKGVPNDADVVFSAALPKNFKEAYQDFLVEMDAVNSKDMETELRLHFSKHQMNDIRSVRSVVGYARKTEGVPKGALLVMLEEKAILQTTPKELSKSWIIAPHKNILVIGDVLSVKSSISHLNDQKSLSSETELMALARKHVPTAAFFAAASGRVLKGEKFNVFINGSETAWLKMEPRRMSGEIRASESTVAIINTAIGFGFAEGLTKIREEKEEHLDKPWAGAGAILAYYFVKDIIGKLRPKLEKNSISFEMNMQEGYGTWMVYFASTAASFAGKAFSGLIDGANKKSKLLQ